MRINQDHLYSVIDKLKTGYALGTKDREMLTSLLQSITTPVGHSMVTVISSDVSAINGMSKALVHTMAEYDVDHGVSGIDTPPSIIPWWEEEGMKDSKWQINRIDLYTKER